MKKIISNQGIYLSIFILLFLSGCLGIKSTNVSLQKEDGLYLSKDYTLAYAYLYNGDTLRRISFKYEEPKEGEELIKITRNGFYPDYAMQNDVENGGKSLGCLVVMSQKDKDYKYCRSNFTKRTVLSTGVAAIWNAGATLTTVGLNVATGTIADPKFFDKDRFLQVVKDNNLKKIRDRVLEINSLEQQFNKELNYLYDEYKNKYDENIKNITFKYNYNDKSGLLFSKQLNHDLKINTIYPDRNLYSLYKHYQEERFSSIDEMNSFFIDLKNKLEKNFEKEKISYKKEYLVKNFNEYSFLAQNDNYFKLNENITFNGKLTLPKNIKYHYGKKVIVPIKVQIDSVNISNISLKQYFMMDKNIDVSFENQKGNFIDVIVGNKTSSFLTVKSLTSYVDSDVYTLSNINTEIAPDSQTLNSNSSYSLFSSKMVQKFSMNKITRKALSKDINYGFAIKYYIQDSNLEKTVFNKKKISLLELYKSYL